MSVTVNQLQKSLSANSTATAFSGKAATTTKPSGSGVFDLLDSALGLHIGEKISKFIQLIPYGAGADTTTFSMRLWGWSQTNDDTEVWIPQLLAELSCTLAAGTPGADFTALTASNYGCDTITLVAGDQDADIISPANDTPGSAAVHLRGSELIEFTYDMTGATSGNCLWRVFDQ